MFSPYYRNGNTDVVSYLLKEANCNPNCSDIAGNTPLSIASKPKIIRELLRFGADPKSDYERCSRFLPSSFPAQPAGSAVKVFVVGDHGAGKTTLTEAIKIQAKSTGFARIVNRVTKVTGIELKTAGVIPHEVESTNFGHVTLYDFAGHKEFYASHDSLVRNVVTGSSVAVFLLVTDLRMSDKGFRESIICWLNFIDNRCSSLHNKPHIIIIGSHADKVKSKEEKSRKSNIVASLQSAMEFPGLHFSGYITMNCCYGESYSMSDLRRLMEQSCKVLRSKVVSTFRSHCFFVYLIDKFRESTAVTLGEILNEVKIESKLQLLDVVPCSTADEVCKVCQEMNERGNVLFLKNETSIENSWIILDKAVLLTRVTGTVFAPEGFTQHRDLASSTGVVPFSKFATVFPDLNPNMIVQFLCHLEFCQEITDPEILHLLQGDHYPTPTASEKYFFFPNLVSVEAQREGEEISNGLVGTGPVWEHDAQFGYHCGWLLQCSKPDQFLMARFLHILLLRLAFAFAMVPHAQEATSDLPTIKRKCRVWINGIYWANRAGVEALVEVVDNSSRVTVMLRCLSGQEIDCIHLRSAIIRNINNAKRECCPKVATSEYFVLLSDASQHPLKPPSDLVLVSCPELATAVVMSKPAALDTNNKTRKIDTLLHCEAYAYYGETVLQELFNENHPMYTQVVSGTFLAKSSHIDHVTESLVRMLTPHDTPVSESIQETVRLLQSWRHQTCQSLRKELDKFSVFAGRNPLVRIHHRAILCTFRVLVFSEWEGGPRLSFPFTAPVMFQDCLSVGDCWSSSSAPRAHTSSGATPG